MKKYILIICLLVFIDQMSKWCVMLLLQNISVIKICSFVQISEVWNTGISFGMMHNLMYSNLIFCSISVVITSLLFYFLISDLFDKMPIAIIIGGSIGNIIDRIRYGAVYDFIDIYVKNWHWPAFNFADSFIVIGISIILMKSIPKNKRK
ncbi:signal peptidase II [Ehrlichia ruminantium]|uniref:Lipoprotein signal peptidase n=1 Tax=Ehrlichia ruminantium (strain Welgevonden) TaxID=254945 RepID=A0A0H3M082_EHRRW|nr:signal peptidase II [Ehrlichia ruminantium]QLK53662.1 signal peptidase II [Ehrlichia ruminantium]QLK55499.1 signal peptidase II [Ehrlichia ruminantium]QLK56415.1 signal peptidase II [Ehrlichia ruminantium]UOD99614.1 signal peptidase II [Ehrlichia ruminantium]CAH58546.1 lipoprotein signal peptidase [Ehrlichia ruminantium str. Welgevonden]